MFKQRNRNDMEDIEKSWKEYNYYANKLSSVLGRTSNIVGEYAEYITCKYYQGELLPSSHPSADIKGKNNMLYQVKSRKLKTVSATQLGIIRSWKFNFLVVILFNNDGTVHKALEIPVEEAKKHATKNSHQNGWVITTSQKFLTNALSKDITNCIQ